MNMICNFRGSLDPEIIPEEWLLERMRLYRNRLLAESDWAVLPDSPADKDAWALYRQSLRDFPESWVPSEIVEFPDAPV